MNAYNWLSHIIPERNIKRIAVQTYMRKKLSRWIRKLKTEASFVVLQALKKFFEFFYSFELQKNEKNTFKYRNRIDYNQLHTEGRGDSVI